MKKKKSNARSVILNGVAMLLSILVMVFYACPHIKGTTSVGGISETLTRNGFETMKDMFDVENEATATIAGIMILVVFILAALILIISIVNTLSSLGVIKNMRVLRAINMFLSALLVLAGLLAVIFVAVYLKDVRGIITTYSNGWANIVNMVLTFGICSMLVLDFLWTKK